MNPSDASQQQKSAPNLASLPNPFIIAPPVVRPPIPVLPHPSPFIACGKFKMVPVAPANTAVVEQSSTIGIKRKVEDADESSTEPGNNKKTKAVIIDDQAAKILSEIELGIPFLTSGKVGAWALHPDTEAFKNIRQYVSRGQKTFGVKILTILEVKPNALQKAEVRPEADPNSQRKMLWFGAQKKHIGSILETGKMLTKRKERYGNEIYFSDRVTSAWRWQTPAFKPKAKYGKVAYLFLCDVLLHNTLKSYEKMKEVQFWKETPTFIGFTGIKRYNSVQCCGQYVPDKKGDKVIDGCVWPLGPTIPNEEDAKLYWEKLSARNNAFIVFKSADVRPKYLVKVEITRDLVADENY